MLLLMGKSSSNQFIMKLFLFKPLISKQIIVVSLVKMLNHFVQVLNEVSKTMSMFPIVLVLDLIVQALFSTLF